jgi:hypothetical protein
VPLTRFAHAGIVNRVDCVESTGRPGQVRVSLRIIFLPVAEPQPEVCRWGAWSRAYVLMRHC